MHWFGGREQLSLELFNETPRNAIELLARLRLLGLGPDYRVRLTSNRSVVVSHGGGELRLHQSYLEAGEEIWRAIITFVHGRTRLARQEAKRKILEFPVAIARAESPRPRRPERMEPADEALAHELASHHQRLNDERFGGTLRPIAIRISRRMKSRLGHYSPRSDQNAPEIVLSRRHIRRDGWAEALHTLMHEMVHQWQDEQGLVVDHGSAFRSKARAVGITPLACRAVA